MKTEEIFEPTMTVREYVSLGTRLKIKSGFNGKILCSEYIPRLHDKKYGDRIITVICSEIKTFENGFDNLAKPILVCFVKGDVEYNLFKSKVEKHE